MRRLATLTKGTRMTAIVTGVTTTTIIIQGARKEESIGKRDIGMIDTEGTDIMRVVDEGTDIEEVDIGRKDVKGTDKEMMTVITVEEGILVLLSRNLTPSLCQSELMIKIHSHNVYICTITKRARGYFSKNVTF